MAFLNVPAGVIGARRRCLLPVLSRAPPRPRRGTVCASVVPASKTEPSSASSSEFDLVKDVQVMSVADGTSVSVSSLWNVKEGERVAVAFLTHFGDFSSWELGQKISAKLKTFDNSGVKVVCIGLGSKENGNSFAEFVNLPPELVFADADGICHDVLRFEKGFAPKLNVNAYIKLLPMLAGIGSPGTVGEVLRGYVGDRNAKQIFDSPSSFDVLGKGYQRPFELATLRLNNMIQILNHWSELAPNKTDLLTWQGGAIVFEGDQVIFQHRDRGILTYVDFDNFLKAALA